MANAEGITDRSLFSVVHFHQTLQRQEMSILASDLWLAQQHCGAVIIAAFWLLQTLIQALMGCTVVIFWSKYKPFL